MPQRKFYTPVKIVGYAVLALMVVAACYSFTMTIVHWAGINV